MAKGDREFSRGKKPNSKAMTFHPTGDPKFPVEVKIAEYDKPKESFVLSRKQTVRAASELPKMLL